MIIVSQDEYNILNFDTTINIGVEEISTLNDIVQIYQENTKTKKEQKKCCKK